MSSTQPLVTRSSSSSSSSFQQLSDDEIIAFTETAEKIAEQVAKNSLECNSNRVNIVGPRASFGEKKHGSFLGKGTVEVITSKTNKNSYIFNGLDETTIRLSGKVNHVFIRDCCNTKIQIDHGVISGLTIFRGNKIVVNLPQQNTTAVEETSNVTVSGYITPDTIIYVTASQDVTINNENLPIHPFIQGIFTKGLFFPTRYVPSELQTINTTRTQVVSIQV